MEIWNDTIYVTGLPKDVTEQRCVLLNRPSLAPAFSLVSWEASSGSSLAWQCGGFAAGIIMLRVERCFLQCPMFSYLFIHFPPTMAVQMVRLGSEMQTEQGTAAVCHVHPCSRFLNDCLQEEHGNYYLRLCF